MNTSTTAQVYVACLASYNNSILFGDWLDANQDADDLREEIAALLRRSPCPNVEVDCPDCWRVKDGETCATCKGTGKVPSAEEWAIHDYDGVPDMGENPNLDKLCEAARMTAEHGPAWSAYCDHVGADFATEEGFQDSYRGTYRTAEDYAEELLSECGDLESIPENLRNYFDFERYARDMSYEGYYFASGGEGVYVFAPN